MGEELKLTRRSILAGAAATGAFVQAATSQPAQAQTVMSKATAADIAKLPRIKAKLVDPPFVQAHEQVATSGPKVVEFEMTIHEKKIVLDDAGTETFAFTFNGTVPGPLMVVHEGDYVELTL
ncbi:MAG: nitrite reductase, copper-containing, partial [Bosea sp. (in: a-proteobacteria)]|nr:nitrite reductase, copper-containing [Bosea sp. (in: a-proteobacteria)]